MQKDKTIRSIISARFIITRAVVALLLAAATVTAQTDAGKDKKDQPFYTAKSSTPASKAPSSLSQQYEKEGILVDFSMKAIQAEGGNDLGLAAGADALVSFRLTDKRTGQAITGLHPSAWLSSRTAEHSPNEAECKDKIRTFVSGSLSARADVDLNSYLMLTLNHDNTITFINPQVSFNITKLESIITLPGPGSDWTLSKDKGFVYVSMPSQSAVAVVNAITRKLVATIPTGEKTKPVRIYLQPDGRYVWVGLDDSPAVAVIDTTTNKLAATVPAGAGLHNIAFTSDSRLAYVTNSGADTVTAIDTKTLSKVGDIPTGKTPVAVAYSSASDSIYVAAINGGALTVINPARQQVIKTIPTKRGVVALRFDPSGRYGFAVNQVESAVSVIDASTNQALVESAVVKGPDQVTFTRLYAYIRGTESEKFSLIELSEVSKGKLSPVEIQAGRLAASTLPQEIGVADMIRPTPEGNSVMIANVADQMIYYYVEGMMVPMGTFQNYKRRPRALMLIDRSLSETTPGVYSSAVKLTKAGTFDLPFLVDQPRIVNCFEVKVGDSPYGEAAKATASTVIEPLFKGNRFKPGEAVTLRFKISDSITKKTLGGLKDVQVLIFEPPGIWQKRVMAKEVGEGMYEVTETFPHVGLFRVMTQIQSRGVRYADQPFTAVPVMSESQAGEAKKQEGVKK
ncbi:MAG TPA: cytochrome D1 domain-containing protein [Blastocatellia bacterium]|nr:cytochrome D1 domain-containing protein [Blastocatellia bacterium]